ncbi:hypothetical protein J4446_02880 [Candidatus Woesearchaeota archaeon]|nr:hypothetical protein [Candidatus Woesearchaeota archaeon]
MAYESLIAFVNSPWIYLIIIWDVVWKGVALWKSARNRHLVWFVFILIVNSVGILPIIYLLIHGKKEKNKKK